MNFVEAMTAAQAGYDTWAAKPHNAKWAKMIYHTPIPNDLLVNIATEVVAATRAADAKAQGWDAIADDIEALQIFAQGRALGGERLIPWAIKMLSEMKPPACETIRTTQEGSNYGAICKSCGQMFLLSGPVHICRGLNSLNPTTPSRN